MDLYFREFGSGSPIVILHGLFGFSDNWQTIAKLLGEHHTVFTPDLRNHGRSPHTATHSYPEMAEDLKKFMEKQGMFHAAIVGHSMGGKVAMQFALDHPEMVEKLVVVDIEPSQAADNHHDVFKALHELDFSKITNRNEADDFLAHRIEDPGTRQFLLKNITREPDGGFSWKMNLKTLTREYPKILAPVRPQHVGDVFEKPTLFVRGGRSNYIKNSEIPLIHSLFPLAEVVTVEGAGHWVHAEKPKELLVILQEFLKD